MKHVCWFIVSSDITYDVVLGRLFCKDSKLTCFDDILTPWAATKQETIESDSESETAPSKSNSAAASAVQREDTSCPEFSDEEMAIKQAEFDEAMADCPASLFEQLGSKHPVTGRPIIRNPNAVGPSKVERKGVHVAAEHMTIMKNECAKIVAQQPLEQRCSIIRIMSTNAKSNESQKSAEEVEKIARVQQQLADDAAKFY